MRARHFLKQGIILVIEGDANLLTIIVRISKKTIIRFLDTLIPDDEQVQVKS